MFTHLAVDKVATGLYSDRKDYVLYYIGTKGGKVYKVSQWRDEDGLQKSLLLDVFQGTVEEEPIRAMEISRRKRMLYVTSDTAIRQVDFLINY